MEPGSFRDGASSFRLLLSPFVSVPILQVFLANVSVRTETGSFVKKVKLRFIGDKERSQLLKLSNVYLSMTKT